MKLFHIDCELNYEVTQQTVFLFNIAVHPMDDQHVLAEDVRAQPALPIEHLRDRATGNRLLRLDVPAGSFSLRYLATVGKDRVLTDLQSNEVPVARLPAETLQYLLPSRYCEADSLFALAWRKFGELQPGYSRVAAICQWIRDNVDYQIGVTHVHSTACDVLATRAGVCRDFAHVAIALCRALNIPARLVTGYAEYQEPPADFHAIFEAYLGDRWHLFDPTELALPSDVIRIGTGRDASDAAFVTFFGGAKLRRLSPLIVASKAGSDVPGFVYLQQPESGIRLVA